MQAALTEFKFDVSIKLILQITLLIVLGTMAVVFSENTISIIMLLVSGGILFYNNFIYNTQKTKIFLFQAVIGLLIGFAVSLLLQLFPVALLPITIAMCFFIGFAIHVRTILIFACAVAISLILNNSSGATAASATTLIYEFIWLCSGVVVYFVSCVAFDGYISEHKLIDSKKIDKIIADTWLQINQLNMVNRSEVLANIDRQLERLTREVGRLLLIERDYQYYCQLDDNFAYQIEDKLNKLTSFHDLLAKQVYNIMLSQNKQLIAEENIQEFDEISD